MLKKTFSILMMYSAFAIMLGHDFIEHHHHDVEHHSVSHHHSNGHHHQNNTDDEGVDWGDYFSSFHHGAEGVKFITAHSSAYHFANQISHFTAFYSTQFVFNPLLLEVRQNAPPILAAFYNSQVFLPFGLRAPPAFIV